MPRSYRFALALALGLGMVPTPSSAQDSDLSARPRYQDPPAATATAASPTAAEDGGEADRSFHLRAVSRGSGSDRCLAYEDVQNPNLKTPPGPMIEITPGHKLHVRLDNALKPFSVEELTALRPRVLHPGESAETAKFLADQSAVTNLHTHGLHVDPNGRSDNVLLKINPGKNNRYTFELPRHHAPGTHWYHAHLHGSTALQVQRGLAGALIVNPLPDQGLDPVGFEIETRVPIIQLGCVQPATLTEVSAARELKSLRAEALPEDLRFLAGLEDGAEREDRIDALGEAAQRTLAEALGLLPITPPSFVVNGLEAPVLEVTSGKIQRLRLINAGARRLDYKGFWVEGHDIYLAAFDGVNLRRLARDAKGELIAYNEGRPLLLAPGNRADVYFMPNGTGEFRFLLEGELGVRLTDRTALSQTFRQELMTLSVSAPPKKESDGDGGDEKLVDGAAEMDRFLAALDARLGRLQRLTPYLAYLRPFGENDAPKVRRNLRFGIEDQEDRGKRSFQINGRDYNVLENERMRGHDDYLGRKERTDGGLGPEGQVPWPPRMGVPEEWVVEHIAAGDRPDRPKHSFHIHVSPFWVHDIHEKQGDTLVSVRTTNPHDPRLNRWQDTIDIPKGGSVTLWTRFDGFTGLYVMHCHVLQHEDRGMMMNILTMPSGGPIPPGAFFSALMDSNRRINEEINR